jgi:hypothetical protein
MGSNSYSKVKLKHLNAKLDPHTFGGSRASEALADILSKQHPNLISKVACVYHHFSVCMKGLRKSWPNFKGTEAIFLMELCRTHLFDKVKNFNLPPLVESHLLNIMTASYRDNRKIAYAEANERRKQQILRDKNEVKF